MPNSIRLFRNNIWLTQPDKLGYAFLGISDYAKQYFSALQSLSHDFYPRTTYGIDYAKLIDFFLKDYHYRHRNSQKIGEFHNSIYRRFAIKQDQPICMMKAHGFDVELLAPVQLRVVDISWECSQKWALLSAPYFYGVQVLKPEQLTSLQSESQYNSEPKQMLYA